MLINLSYFQLCLFVIDGNRCNRCTDGTSGGGKAPAFHGLDKNIFDLMTNTNRVHKRRCSEMNFHYIVTPIHSTIQFYSIDRSEHHSE